MHLKGYSTDTGMNASVVLFAANYVTEPAAEGLNNSVPWLGGTL